VAHPIPDADASRTRKRHLLYIAWGFPPSRSAGVYRALATANRFAERGWDVTVVTVEAAVFDRYTGSDPSLTDLIHPGIAVVRTPFAWPMLEWEISRWSWWRVHASRTWARWRRARDLWHFPEIGYGPWRPALERSVLDIHRRHRVDLAMATASPYVSFSGARRLARAGVPYVLDYRDAWQLDVFSGARVTPAGSRVGRTERRMINGATEVWFVNDRIRDWHRAAHPTASDRMVTVENGYDPATAPIARVPATGRADPTFGYVGTVTPKVPMAEFVAGWRTARARGLFPSGACAEIHGYLGYYGDPRQDMLGELAAAQADGVTYRGPVAKGNIAVTYQRFDALLLILGAGRYVTSGKVYEYLAAALPIVSVHDPENAVSMLLRDYPLWFPAASLAPDDVAEALTNAAAEVASPDSERREAAADFGRRRRRSAQLDPRISALTQLVDAQ